jgi:hypothetical protein
MKPGSIFMLLVVGDKSNFSFFLSVGETLLFSVVDSYMIRTYFLHVR